MTEPGLTWRRSFEATGPRGESCERFDCVQHPRLFRLVQRANPDAEVLTTYHVQGLAQIWHEEGAAVSALQANR